MKVAKTLFVLSFIFIIFAFSHEGEKVEVQVFDRMPADLMFRLNDSGIDSRNIAMLPTEKLYHVYTYVITVTGSNLDVEEYKTSHPKDGPLESSANGDGERIVTIFSDSIPEKSFFPKWEWKKE